MLKAVSFFALPTIALSFALMGAAPSQAQGTNPLQQPSTSQQPARTTQPAARSQPAPKAETKAEATEEKPKRQRSEAQLANDNRLRRCGQEWRANKDKLTGQGYNWIKFSTECRARLKAAGQ
ncbi:MAG: hypothetical protein ACRCWO_10125 [Bosea sp. (in: a-proteobacteria)]